MISFADIATQTNVCKTLALALPRFYNKTKISAEISFVYSVKTESTEISLSFSELPSEEQYAVFFEELNNAEKLLLSEYVINNANSFENLKQMVFKHKEELNQIIDRQRNG